MSVHELRQKLAGLCDQQQAIVDKAVKEGRPMTEEEKAQFDALQNQIDGLNETIKIAENVEARAKELEKPADEILRPGSKQEKILDDGGFENLGEFIYAVRFGDRKGRLKNWSMGDGQEGGFAVPEKFREEILSISPENAIVRPRAQVIPAGDPPDAKITMPAFSQGAKGVYGGVEVYWIAEGGEKPETDGNLEVISLEPQEVAAHTTVTDKLLRNWQAASSFISGLLRQAIIAAEDMAFLRGDGVGKPLGVLNLPGKISVKRDTSAKVKYIDIVNMMAKMLPESLDNAVWVANQSVLPEIMTMTDENGNYIFIRGDATRGVSDTLAGIPIRWTGKTPTLGNEGDLQLVDFSYYLIKDGSGPFIAASEHVYFKNNKTVIKAFWNVDGQGWVKEPLILEDGSTKVSPYVVLK
ncbi:MAG: phage major capsid protein [Thermoanaerobacteraceae bacterium]|nr:phage major capsid protein [Thermoanaerobacteraceae bacterium]